jgi:hypothetical protein
MAQKPGQAHALHTFVGKSGAVPGMSHQATEGGAAFKSAAVEVLPEDARATTKYIFSDSPDSVAGAAEVFPALVATAEDGFHLVIRVEYCFGEKRSALSSELLLLQMKFRAQSLGT